jgi:hypothetical protein
MMISRKAGLRYVSRGDVAAYDATEITLTADNAAHTLSLASVVPANAKLVLVRFRCANAAANKVFWVGKVGYANAFAVSKVYSLVANYPSESTGIVELSSQSIAYLAAAGSWVSLGIVVIGWWV